MTPKAHTFIKSINKYYKANSYKKLDNETNSSLDKFDTKLLDNKKIRFNTSPSNIETLESVARDSLHKYISHNNQKLMTHDQISFIVSAIVYDQMISSTDGKGIARKAFDEELEKRIFLLSDKYSPKRISIGIKSFIRGKENLEEETMSCLSLVQKFNGQNIKDNHNWNTDIYEDLYGKSMAFNNMAFKSLQKTVYFLA